MVDSEVLIFFLRWFKQSNGIDLAVKISVIQGVVIQGVAIHEVRMADTSLSSQDVSRGHLMGSGHG